VLVLEKGLLAALATLPFTGTVHLAKGSNSAFDYELVKKMALQIAKDSKE
jgi:hypothetical protein